MENRELKEEIERLKKERDTYKWKFEALQETLLDIIGKELTQSEIENLFKKAERISNKLLKETDKANNEALEITPDIIEMLTNELKEIQGIRFGGK